MTFIVPISQDKALNFYLYKFDEKYKFVTDETNQKLIIQWFEMRIPTINVTNANLIAELVMSRFF